MTRLPHDVRRRPDRARWVAVLAGLALLASACTSGNEASPSSETAPPGAAASTDAGKDPGSATGSAQAGAEGGTAATGTASPPPASGEGEQKPAEGTALTPSPVVFTSTDGTAFAGSRTVFTLTNTATGTSVDYSVDGAGADTRAEFYPGIGTFTVSVGSGFVGPTGSWTVKDLSPEQITVTEAAAPEPVAVNFALAVQHSPVDLQIESTTAAEVALTWAAADGVTVADYQLRQTPGAVAAAGPTEGQAIELKDPQGISAVAGSLSPETEYTFTLFATAADGTALSPRSVTVTTPKADGSTPAYALAPNTIVPTDFAALNATSLGNSRIAVTLGADNDARSSVSAIPGVDPATLNEGCVPGLPFLASSEIAGDQAFFGVIESCIPAPSALRAPTEAQLAAVVNGDVPLAAVIPYLSLRNSQVHHCIDASGTELGPDAALCKGKDTDGDGMKDTAEAALDRDPAKADDGWTAFLNEARTPPVATPAEDLQDVTDLEAPAGLGTGDVQVTLLWNSGDDLDLAVRDPSGASVTFEQPTSASGGRLDVDNQGDLGCATNETRAENVFWDKDAPRGTYTVSVTNFRQNDACGPNVQARLEVRIAGKLQLEQILTVDAGLPITFGVAADPSTGALLTVADVPAPTGLDTGDLQVTVLSAGVDEMGVGVYEPGGGRQASYEITQNSNVVKRNDFDRPGCLPAKPANARVGNIAYKVAAPGTYRIAPGIFSDPCGSKAGAEAWVEVRVRGELVARRAFVLPGPNKGDRAAREFTVVVPPAAQGLRAGGSAITSGTPGVTLGSGAAMPKVECEGTMDAKFDPQFGYDEFSDVDLSLKGSSFRWNIEAGVTISMDPKLTVEAGAECALKIDGVTFQLMNVPVPIDLELAPVVEGSVKGSYELTGPKLDVTFGVRTKGNVDARMETCGWFDLPCGIDVGTAATAEPITGFDHGEASLAAKGTFEVGVGVEATLGVGIKNALFTGKAGFAIKMKPIVGTAEAVVKTTVQTKPTPPPKPTASQSAPPYSPAKLLDVFLDQTQGKDAPTFTTDLWGKRPLVGPVSSGTCTGGEEIPYPYRFTVKGKQYKTYRCRDAMCTDGNTLTSIDTEFDACKKARCVADGKTVDSGKKSDSIVECRQAAVEPIEIDFLNNGVDVAPGVNISACAEVALGGSLGVDFRAEAWVLAWGDDKRFPIWSDDVKYPGAEFSIGKCDE